MTWLHTFNSRVLLKRKKNTVSTRFTSYLNLFSMIELPLTVDFYPLYSINLRLSQKVSNTNMYSLFLMRRQRIAFFLKRRKYKSLVLILKRVCRSFNFSGLYKVNIFAGQGLTLLKNRSNTVVIFFRLISMEAGVLEFLI